VGLFAAWLTEGTGAYLDGIGFICRACILLLPYVGPTEVGGVRVSVERGVMGEETGRRCF